MSKGLKHPGVIRVMGIDPSTTNMGVWFVDVNLEKCEPFKLIYGNTLYGDKLLYDVPVQFDDLASTKVMARSYCMARSLRILINLYNPDVAICEDNFLGMSALTFKQLIQCVGLLREACSSCNVHLSMVLPNLAKAIVGVTARGMTKDDIAEGILNYTWLDSGDHDLSVMDEHSMDAGAVTLYRCESIAKHYGVFRDDQ